MSFLIKLIFLIILTTCFDFPLIDPIDLFCWFICVLLIIFAEPIKDLNFKYKYVLLLFCAGLVVNFLPKVQIEEGNNLILFQDGKNLAIKSIFPNSIYESMKSEFEENYEKSNDRCSGNKSAHTGCWRDYKMSDRPYSFSMDSIYKNSNFSRVVDHINFDDVVKLRSGFLNGLFVDFNTNWYEWKSKGDPKRQEAPFFVHWKFPSKLGGQICILGKFFILKNKALEQKYEYSNNFKCLNISKENPIEIIGYRINPNENLKAKYFPENKYILLNILKKILLFIFCLYIINKIFIINFKDSFIVFALTSLSFITLDVTNGFAKFYQHKFLLNGAGGDAQTYWGFARYMMYNFNEGELLKTLSGGENIFFYMPGYRYFLFFQSFLFGESNIFSWLCILITPTIIFYIIKRFCSETEALIFTSCFILIFLKSYYSGAFNHAEVIAYPLSLLSLLYTIKYYEESLENKKYKYIFISAFLFCLAIFCRPNLILPALFMHGFVFIKNFNTKLFLYFFMGYFFLLLLPLHNLYFGNEFVLITSSATIPNNMNNGPIIWFNAFGDMINNNWSSEKVLIFSNYMKKYFNGPAVQPFYLIFLIIPSLFLWSVFKQFKIKIPTFSKVFNINYIYIMSLIILGTHIVCWFFKPGGRYTYLAFILTLMIIYIFTLKIIKLNKTKQFSYLVLIESFLKNQISFGPTNLKFGLLSCWPIGYFPFYPATLSSFVFAIIGYILNVTYDSSLTLILGILLFVLGVFLCAILEKKVSEKDPSWVVLDEASCQLLVSAFAGSNLIAHLIGFLLFRFFDISKIGPIKRLEKIPHGVGIMADDLAAALFSICFMAIYLYSGFF